MAKTVGSIGTLTFTSNVGGATSPYTASEVTNVSISATVTSTGSGTGSGTVYLYYSLDGGATFVAIGTAQTLSFSNAAPSATATFSGLNLSAIPSATLNGTAGDIQFYVSTSATAAGLGGAITSAASAQTFDFQAPAPSVALTEIGNSNGTADLIHGESVKITVSGLGTGETGTVVLHNDINGSTFTVSVSGNGDTTLNTAALSAAFGLPVGTSFRLSATISATDPAGNTTSNVAGTNTLTTIICFYPGTLIATPDGARAVETLQIGDLVLTSEGKAAPVRWMGRQTVSTLFADKQRVLPVRIAAGALGGGLPQRDLLVSPDHALFLDGVLVQAAALVGMPGIGREHAVPQTFTYHHVELADHSLILAEGVAAETFVDNADRANFDNWAEHEALYGTLPSIPEMALPRAKSARQLPSALRARLVGAAAA